MRMLVWALFLLGTVASAAAFAQTPLRPGDLLANPQSYLNRNVEIDIVEPLSGPRTPEALARVEYGQLRVELPDGFGIELALVPPGFQANDPNRYKRKFDRVIVPPVRVRGEFLSDDDLAKQTKRPAYVIRVASIEPLPLAPAEPVNLAQLKADGPRWDRKRVIYEGVYRSAFEVSTLDDAIWFGIAQNAVIVGKSSGENKGSRANRVRVTGMLFAKLKAHYGHLGSYRFELIADKVEYLGAAPP